MKNLIKKIFWGIWIALTLPFKLAIIIIKNIFKGLKNFFKVFIKCCGCCKRRKVTIFIYDLQPHHELSYLLSPETPVTTEIKKHTLRSPDLIEVQNSPSMRRTCIPDFKYNYSPSDDEEIQDEKNPTTPIDVAKKLFD